MGGGDGGKAVLGGGDAHQQLGQVGVVAEVLDVLVQPALLIVDGDSVVAGGPADAVPEGVPAVLIVVDADVLQQSQLLPQGQDLLRGRVLGDSAAGVVVHDLAVVVHLDHATVNPLSILVHKPQGAAVVDVEGEGVGAGGLVAVVHREGNLIGVLQATPCQYRRRVQRVAAFCLIDRERGDRYNVVVRLHPLDGEGGGLPLGQALQLPADLHRPMFVGDVEVRRPDQPCGDGLALQNNAHPGGQGRVRILRVGGGDHHGVGHAAALRGHCRQHPRRELDAVNVLVNGIDLHRGLTLQRCVLAGEVPLIEVDGILDGVFLAGQSTQVAVPAEGEGGIPLGGHGAGGEIQIGRRSRGHIELPKVGADHVVAGIIRGAVVGGEDTPDPAVVIIEVVDWGDYNLCVVIWVNFLKCDQLSGFSVQTFIGPCPRGIGGGIPTRGVETGGQGGIGALVCRVDGGAGARAAFGVGAGGEPHAGHVVGGGVGEAFVQPGQLDPVGVVRRALVDLEDGVVQVCRICPRRHRKGLRGKPVRLQLDGQVVHCIVPIDRRPEGQHAVFGVVARDVLQVRLVIGQGDGDRGSAGEVGPLLHGHIQAGDGVAPLGADERHAGHGHTVDRHRVAPEVADAGALRVAEGDGQPGVVHRPHPVPQHQPVARSVHMQVRGAIWIAVDVDDGALRHLHKLVKGQRDGDDLPGVVGPRRGGDALQPRICVVVFQGHGALCNAVLYPGE